MTDNQVLNILFEGKKKKQAPKESQPLQQKK